MKDPTVMVIRISKIKITEGKVFYRLLTDSKKIPAGWVEIPSKIISKVSNLERNFIVQTLSKEIALLIELYVRYRKEFKSYKILLDKEEFLQGSIRRSAEEKVWHDERMQIETDDVNIISEVMRSTNGVFD